MINKTTTVKKLTESNNTDKINNNEKHQYTCRPTDKLIT